MAEASAEYLSWTGSWLLEGDNIDGTPAQDTITVVDYNYYTMPKPYFPMTMTRIEDSASASAKAVPAGQVTASARKGKVAKAGYRTLSPLKTVYKVR